MKLTTKRKIKSIFFPTPFAAFIWVMLVAAVYGSVKIGKILFYQSDYFKVEHIQVSGARYLDENNIRELANIDINQIMYHVDLANITRNLLSNEYIYGVSVTRVLPSTIRIDIQEREPVIYIVDNFLYMVDNSGIILKKLSKMPIGNTPIVTGLALKELEEDSVSVFPVIKLAAKIREVDESLIPFISEISIKENKEPELVLIKGAARVILGGVHHYERLYLLSRLLNKQPIVNNLANIKQIDLTFKNRIIVQNKS